MLLFGILYAGQAAAESNGCLQCHAGLAEGFNAAHGFAATHCDACHAGDAGALTESTAHAGLIAFPGDLATSERACGACHLDRVSSVKSGLMHTGQGIVRTTRQVIDGDEGSSGPANFQSLGHSAADSLLRKQCASCHLGQPKTKHALDVTFDRGGGCLACHINDQAGQGHPALSTRVDDGRCFGCHSRSGRISLSYAGLAEVDARADGAAALLLADGRTVERLPADAHYVAGMSCIDCHTSVGLMGAAGEAAHQRQAVDIQCADCHDNGNLRIGLAEWPAALGSVKKHIPFTSNTETRFLVTEKFKTPLWRIEIRDETTVLHTRNTNRRLAIPPLDTTIPGHDAEHERLTCSACHSQWAPQCFGCHMQYQADGRQWDHIEKRETKGRWTDRRWRVDNSLPALGVNADGEIESFVPGMIMTIDHPSFDDTRFVRRFSPLSPHTVGKSRSCESCHRAARALGLGEGELRNGAGGLAFSPTEGQLQDGLPADAWTGIGNHEGGQAPPHGPRPFSAGEMQSIVDADIATKGKSAR